ncbi:MAG: NAD-dependent epimerase/dehydratase family protein, partial [Patescibacteria group bacterium]
MKTRRVLITGVSGFIGKNLFDKLRQREDLEVIGVSRHPLDYNGSRLTLNPYLWSVRTCDLMDKEQVRKITEDVDIVIHAAAVSAGAKYIVNDPGFLLDNTILNTNILEAAHKNGVKHFIFLSCSVLYPMDLGRPVTEDDVDYNRIHPKYFAGAWVKIYGEKLCEFYSKLGHTRFTVIRHSNVYGPYDKFDLDRSHVLGATIKKVMDAPPSGDIEVWGDGQGRRDFLYIGDLMRFIELTFDNGLAYEVFNLGSGIVYSTLELTKMVIRLSGKKL